MACQREPLSPRRADVAHDLTSLNDSRDAPALKYLQRTRGFTIVERPEVGSVRVFDRPGDHAELVHLAPHRAGAEQWLSEHGYPNAILDEVTADEAAPDAVEGRAAA